jgi:hypothetical protein
VLAFAATFACVHACSERRDSRRGDVGSDEYLSAATEVVAPTPDQLEGWTYLLAGTSMSREQWHSLSERAEGLRANVNAGDETWVDTVVALESPFFEVDDRLACAAAYGSTIERGCTVRFDLGIERQSRSEGLVVFAHGTAVKPQATDEARLDEAACDLFLRCMTQSKLGGVVPIPNADWPDVVVYQLVGLTPMTDDLHNPENLRVGAKMSTDYSRKLAQQVRDGAIEQTAFLSAKMRGLDDKARYFLRRAAELEGQANK